MRLLFFLERNFVIGVTNIQLSILVGKLLFRLNIFFLACTVGAYFFPPRYGGILCGLPVVK